MPSSARSAPFPCPCTLRTRHRRWGLSFGSVEVLLAFLAFPSFPPPSPPLLTPLPHPSHNSQRTQKEKEEKVRERQTYLQILIRRLLVLLIHRPGGSLGTHTNCYEQREGNPDAERGIASYLPAFAWWRQGAGTVGAEGDVVCCFPRQSSLPNPQPSLPHPLLSCTVLCYIVITHSSNTLPKLKSMV